MVSKLGDFPIGARVSARRALRTAALTALAGSLLGGAARAADPPPLLPIQGFLADAAGNAVDGAHGLRFSLYPSETATTAVYVETDGAVAVTAGNFVVYLGAAEPLPLSLFRDSAQLWLEVVVDGTEVIRPRMRVATAPYAGSAQYCGDATTLGGSPASAFAPAAHTHAFASLTGVPAGLADGDGDTLAALACGEGQVAKLRSGAWGCAVDADTDTLGGIDCAAGQFVRRGSGSGWGCQSLATVATTGSYADLAGLPSGLVTASRGSAGYLPRFATETALASSSLFQDDRGNVGIGVARPGASLDVSGTIRWGGASLLSPGGVIELGDSAAGTSSIDFHFAAAGAQDYNTRIANPADGELRLAANTLRVTETTAGATNVVMGFSGNSVAAAVVGATLSGGGGEDAIGFGGNNAVLSDFGTIAGGFANLAGTSGELYRAGATVGGGQSNSARGTSSTVAGGANNTADADNAAVCGGLGNRAAGAAAFVGGGTGNVATDSNSTVAGGNANTISGYTSTICGGMNNRVGGGTSFIGGGINNVVDGDSATIAGGAANSASGTYGVICGGGNNVASGLYSTVGGGNSNGASATGAMVPGGYLNTAAGTYSFAGGYRAKANQAGCFAWGDAQGFDVACNTPNAWVARATGGVSFVTGVNPGSGATTAGVSVAAGSGTWASLSDRDAKRDVRPVEPRAVLAALERVPVSTWSYRAEVSGARHMGPMAQDFQAAFGLGDSDKRITTVDADGVALAAVVGLHGIGKQHEARLARLARDNAELRARLARLEQRLDAVASCDERRAR